MPNPNNKIKYARRKVGWPQYTASPEELARTSAKLKLWHEAVDKAIEMQNNGASEEEILKFLNNAR